MFKPSKKSKLQDEYEKLHKKMKDAPKDTGALRNPLSIFRKKKNSLI